MSARLDAFVDDEPTAHLHDDRSRAREPRTIDESAAHEAIRAHLRHCVGCDHVAQQLRAVRLLLRDVGHREAATRRAPDALRERVHAMLNRGRA